MPRYYTQRGQEPSDRKDGRFPASLGAGGGTHRPCAKCINPAMPLQYGGCYSGLPRTIASCYSPYCLEDVSVLKNPRWAPRVSLAMPSNATQPVWVESRLA